VKSFLDSSFIKKSTEIVFVFTITVFIIGHFSAFIYFSSWDLPYLKLTDTATAFAFALESTGVFLLISLILLLIVFFFFINLSESDDLQEKDTKLASMKFWERTFYNFKDKLVKSLFMIAIIAFLFYSFYIITSGDIRQDIKDKNYIPYQVAFSKGSIVHSCVTSLGTLGSYSLFINELEQVIMIRKDEISYIKQMLLSPPLKTLSSGKMSMDNPDFKKERKQWLSKWDDVCGSYVKSLNFKKFDFKTSAMPPRPEMPER
jgi:hypothetical protein